MKNKKKINVNKLKIITAILLTAAAAVNYSVKSGYFETFTRNGNKYAGFHFIDVGQGDCSLIIAEGKTLMIDTGPNSAVYALERYLDELKIKKIDILFMTHPDEDHIGNADSIITGYRVDKVVYPDIGDPGMDFSSAMSACGIRGTETEIASQGDHYGSGNLTVRVIWPKSGTGTDANESSLVLLVTYGNISLYYAADTGSVTEKKILDEWGSYICDADILKVAHHGSNGSSSRDFVETLKPTYSVISCGKNNPFGHPSPPVTERLKNAGSEILRTDISGSIVFYSDGATIFRESPPLRQE